MEPTDWDALSPTDRYGSIEMQPVESSNISAIGYDDANAVLAVEFKGGAVHHYRGVGASLWTNFKTALSFGQFYAMNVRGKFTSEKLTGECPNCGAKPGLIGGKCVGCGQASYAPECGDEGPDGARCSKPLGHQYSGFESARPHGRGKKTWRWIKGAN